MKTYKYIALAAITLGFAACTQDDDFTTQHEDIVKIASADIATEVQTRVNTLNDGTAWEDNDQILLVNNSRTNKNSGTYTYNGTAWSLTDGTVLYASGANTTNNFTAYYPAIAEAAYTLPIDQSTEASIKSADRMIATSTDVAKGAAVALSFERQHAMVTITPSFNTEFGSNATISSLKINEVTSYHPANASDYKAIIKPSDEGFSVTLTVEEQSLTATSTTKIEAGKHYTFNLTVGKQAITFGNVTVSDWTDTPIADGEAEELIDATQMTAAALETAVTGLLSAGQANIGVVLPSDADMEMFQAIKSAINTAGNVVGNVNLTLAGCTIIPYEDEGAFKQINYLSTVTLPDVVSIEQCAFYGSQNLTSISAPKVTTIGNESFYACSTLSEISMPLAEEIGKSAFHYCTSLSQVNLPKVKTIGETAFYYCEKLTDASFCEATTIGNVAFASCTSLQNITFPKATTIGGSTFKGSKLTSVELPEAEFVGQSAFSGCESLTEVWLPSANTIAGYAFGNCSKLSKVTFGNLVTVSAEEGIFDYGYENPGTTVVGNITLILPGTQRVLEKKAKTTEEGITYYEWEPTDSETLYKDSEDYKNRTFLDYTFKEISL